MSKRILYVTSKVWDWFESQDAAVYFCTIALKNRRPDIAWAYLRGTIAGMSGS